MVLKQMDRVCFRDYMEYKYYCNKVRPFVQNQGDSAPDMETMSLQELQDQYKKMHELWILSQKCGSYRKAFRDKCVPESERNNAHEYEIGSSLNYAEQCKRKLFEISQHIFDKIKAEMDEESVSTEPQISRTSQKSISSKSSKKKKVSKNNKQLLQRIQKDIHLYTDDTSLTNANVQKMLQEYKDEEAEYFIKIGELCYDKLNQALTESVSLLDDLTGILSTLNEDDIQRMREHAECLRNLTPLELASILIDYHYVNKRANMPSLRVIYENLVSDPGTYDIISLTRHILRAYYGFKSFKHFGNYILQKKYTFGNKTMHIHIIRLTFLRIFLEADDDIMIRVTLTDFPEIIRNFDNIVNELSLREKCMIVRFVDSMSEYIHRCLELSQRAKVVVANTQHTRRLVPNMASSGKHAILMRKNIKTYQEMLPQYKRFFDQTVPDSYLKASVRIFGLIRTPTKLFDKINAGTFNEEQKTIILNHHNDDVLWFVDRLTAYLLDTEPLMVFSKAPSAFSA